MLEVTAGEPNSVPVPGLLKKCQNFPTFSNPRWECQIRARIWKSGEGLRATGAGMGATGEGMRMSASSVRVSGSSDRHAWHYIAQSILYTADATSDWSVIEATRASDLPGSLAAGFMTCKPRVWQHWRCVQCIVAAKMERVALPPGLRLAPAGSLSRYTGGFQSVNLRHLECCHAPGAAVTFQALRSGFNLRLLIASCRCRVPRS